MLLRTMHRRSACFLTSRPTENRTGFSKTKTSFLTEHIRLVLQASVAKESTVNSSCYIPFSYTSVVALSLIPFLLSKKKTMNHPADAHTLRYGDSLLPSVPDEYVLTVNNRLTTS